MKLTQEAKTFQTNAQMTSEDFTIGDTAVVIEILRNKLYRHKVRTLVQEYMSNGRDAMREINSTDHIQVTLPTIFAPTFKVRDFGPGISQDRMYNVFIKYAASTKRTDNSQTGGFGIGAKSAWSYTESFTIVTFIDGVQRSYVAHIGANNNGRLDYLGEAPTTEPNGTEIQIPVSPRDIPEFRQSAYRAAYFWKEEEYPLFLNIGNDKPETYVQGDTIGQLEVNNSIPSYIVSSWDAGVVISIDGIPYVAGPSLIDKIEPFAKLTKMVNGRLVLHFGTGEIEVSASREEIADSKVSIEKLTKIADIVLRKVHLKIAQEFKSATTPFEHLSIYMRLVKSYKLDAFRKFGDFEVTQNNVIESDLFESVKFERADMNHKGLLDKGTLGGAGRRRSYSWSRIKISPELVDSIYFTDGSETALITNHRLREVLKNVKTVLIISKLDTDAGQFDKVVAGLGAKNILDVTYTKPDRKARVAKAKEDRLKTAFCIHRKDRFSHQAEYITLADNTQKWLYVERGTDQDTHGLIELNRYVQAKGNWKICALGKDSLRRVKGDKNFKSLATWLENVEADATDVKVLKFEIAQNTNLMNKLAKAQGIKDKLLVSMIEEYKTLKAQGYQVPEIIRKKIGKLDEVEDFKAEDKKLSKELKDRWALLDELSYCMANGNARVMNEVVAYINAK